jgi:hypothetical protein
LLLDLQLGFFSFDADVALAAQGAGVTTSAVAMEGGDCSTESPGRTAADISGGIVEIANPLRAAADAGTGGACQAYH